MFKNIMALTSIAVLLACGSTVNGASDTLQQTIYYGGDIVTMEGDKPTYVEAVIERDGKIIYAGKKSDAVNNFAGKTIGVDLQGKTMVPGITITAARTFEMEDVIGSIKVGKEATFTLLEQNPFKIPSEQMKDILVVGVVYKGKMKLKKGKLVGNDRDTHGCIGSAGYSWCEKTKSCERPWELAKKRGFENTKEAFNTYCNM